MAAAAVHLLFGSPGGRPSLREVSAAVDDLGVDARDLRPAELQPAGVWTVLGEGAAGEPLVIKVYGRDAWDTQLVTQAWRFLWYRHSSARLRLSRERQVEHEALLLLLARAASVDVPKVRAVGRSPSGDTLLVARARRGAGSDRRRSTALWAALAAAHDAGVSPCSIDVDDLGWTADGRRGPQRVGGRHDRAERDAAPAGSRPAPRRDGGHRRAATRRSTRPSPRSATTGRPRCVPYLQESSVPPAMRRRIDDLDDTIEDLRDELSSRLGIEEAELVQLRRVTLVAVVQTGAARAGRLGAHQRLSPGLDFAAVRRRGRRPSRSPAS